jgi:hypothetical protein
MGLLQFIESVSGVVTLPKTNGKSANSGGQRGRQMSPEKLAFFDSLRKTNMFTWDNLTKSKNGQLVVALELSQVPGLPEQEDNETEFDYYSRINAYVANLINSFVSKTFDEAYHKQIAPIKPIKNALAFNSKVEAVNDREGFPVMKGNCQVFSRIPTDFVPQLSTESIADFVNRLNKTYGQQRTMSDCSQETGWVVQPNRMVFLPTCNDYRILFGIRITD